MSHFDLIQKIMKKYPQYKKIVVNKIKQIISVLDTKRIQKIIYEIDKNLPIELNCNKLPDNRKQLMVCLILLRFDKLKEFVK
ncbi:MAG: hypothetical protein LBC02_00695 [Planctomycetaceae bacterium]|jgi:hypothetical protein|nr:hypothetical protein [Planctomycetaceae bacterium]